MQSYYEQFLQKATDVSYDNHRCAQLFEEGLIDEHFNALGDTATLIKKIAYLFKPSSFALTELLDAASANIAQQRDNILSFYHEWFEERTIMGDATAAEHPDILLILGCNRKTLQIRIEYGLQLAKQFPDAYLMFSGGGFNIVESEAEFMASFFMDNGIAKERLILEPDAMDTFGNALFTKLTLLDRKLLDKIRNMLIITSKFHAPRALSYFTKVYQGNCTVNIAINSVDTVETKARELAFARHELSSTSITDSTIFTFNDFLEVNNPAQTIPAGDDFTLLLQCFQNHQLYTRRYDLMRKYFKVMNNSST